MLCALAIAAAGCGVLSPEDQLLTRFFEAARLNDTVVMAKYATVTFNPRAEGVVQAFEIQTRQDLDETSKRLTVVAQIRDPGGRLTTRTLQIALRRDDSAWRITEIR